MTDPAMISVQMVLFAEANEARPSGSVYRLGLEMMMRGQKKSSQK